MKKHLKKWQINNFTYLYFLIALCCGYFKTTILIFTIIIIHELGHLFFIKIFGYQIIKIDIYPFGGLTKINAPINISPNHELIISLGGITSQSLFLLIIFLLKINNEDLIFYNIIIIFFNTMPIFPLDGYKILSALLSKIFAFTKVIKITNIVSNITLIIFIIITFPTKNLIIDTFLIIQSLIMIKNSHYIQERFFLERYLYSFPYQKIISHNNQNYKLMRKNTLHFFKNHNSYIHEKELLTNHYNNLTKK